MAGLTEGLDRVVLELRLGADAAGCEAFTHFIAELSAGLGAAGSGLDPQVLLPALQQALEAQERSDYVALADALQYELRPLLPAGS